MRDRGERMSRRASIGERARALGEVFAVFRAHSFRVAFGQYGLVCILIALIIGYLGHRSTSIVEEQQMQTVEAEIAGLAEQYRQGGVGQLARTIRQRVEQPGNSLYLLARENGQMLAGNLTTVTNALWQTVGEADFTYRRDTQQGEQRAAIGAVFRLPEGYRLIVGRDVEDQRALSRLYGGTLILSVAAILVAGLGIGSLVSYRSRRRIDEAVETSQRIMAGDLAERLRADYADEEFNRLSGSLNAMLGRIEHLVKNYRGLSDNIAHDLKTPLTRLRARAEQALAEPADGREANAALEEIIAEADGLIDTFEAILRISRLEVASNFKELSVCNLRDLVWDICEFYEPLAEEDGWEMRFGALEDVTIRCHPELVRLMLSNLIENAFKYGAGTERTLTICVRHRADAAVVEVADRGPGIAAEDRQRVLERFVRLEESRSQPGNGLGLTMVAAIVDRHRGTLELASNEPGLHVIITLPALLPETAAVRPMPADRSIKSRHAAANDPVGVLGKP